MQKKSQEERSLQLNETLIKLSNRALRNIRLRIKRTVRRMDLAQNLRLIALQTGIYCMIVFGAVSLTISGSEMLIDIISDKMSSMGYEVAIQNLPKAVETASFRPAVE